MDNWIELKPDDILKVGDIIAADEVDLDFAHANPRYGWVNGYITIKGWAGDSVERVIKNFAYASGAWRNRDGGVVKINRNLSNKHFSKPLPLP